MIAYDLPRDDFRSADDLCRELLPLVGRLARGLARVYPFTEYQELFQDGCIGMMRAVRSFDASRGVPLEAYARPLIAGSIFNGIRSRDPLSENARKLLRDAERERERLALENPGSVPTLRELAARISGLGAAMMMSHRASTLSLDAPLPDGESLPVSWNDDPARIVESRDRSHRVRSAVARLTPRQRDVVEKHYFARKTVTAVGDELSISPQRVSQLNSSALANLRKKLVAEA